VKLVAVGRLRDGPEAELFARYQSRLRPRLELQEVIEAKGTASEIRRREGAAILAALPANAWLVALDLGGAALDSVALAQRLAEWQRIGRLIFAIGGAEGLDTMVIDRADQILSLGPLTWPHLLVRAMLAEQLFRAQSILAGHPYHRPWRPEPSGRL
jgi:23S rRNA (pseudouridine1915-N3)-methyltransferase